jgi:hypothetical protein
LNLKHRQLDADPQTRFPGVNAHLQPGKRRLQAKEQLHVFSQVTFSLKQRQLASTQLPEWLQGMNGFLFSQCMVPVFDSHHFGLKGPGGGIARLGTLYRLSLVGTSPFASHL